MSWSQKNYDCIQSIINYLWYIFYLEANINVEAMIFCFVTFYAYSTTVITFMLLFGYTKWLQLSMGIISRTILYKIMFFPTIKSKHKELVKMAFQTLWKNFIGGSLLHSSFLVVDILFWEVKLKPRKWGWWICTIRVSFLPNLPISFSTFFK